jgi:hypothetical protein
MTTGFAVNTANKILDAIGNGVPYSVANTFMKLHIGDPGAAGTANPATETSRKAASFGTPSAGGMTNDVALTSASGMRLPTVLGRSSPLARLRLRPILLAMLTSLLSVMLISTWL